MQQRILVPTDGSPLSERALALTETFGRAQEASSPKAVAAALV